MNFLLKQPIWQFCSFQFWQASTVPFKFVSICIFRSAQSFVCFKCPLVGVSVSCESKELCTDFQYERVLVSISIVLHTLKGITCPSGLDMVLPCILKLKLQVSICTSNNIVWAVVRLKISLQLFYLAKYYSRSTHVLPHNSNEKCLPTTVVHRSDGQIRIYSPYCSIAIAPFKTCRA